jgi:hypothetical protein
MLKHGQLQTTIYTFFQQTKRQDSGFSPGSTAPLPYNNPTTLHSTPTQPPIYQTIARIPDRPPDTDNAIQQAQKRTHTTQQRMTAFFPGRPPDLPPSNPDPGNPPHV